MSTEEEIVEKILSIHDDEFKFWDRPFHLVWFYEFGKWYWPHVFYASKDVLTNKRWDFQISGNLIYSKKLEEKFERIYQKWCDYNDKKDELARENKLKEILSWLKRPSS
jgi:hypothetical protein